MNREILAAAILKTDVLSDIDAADLDRVAAISTLCEYDPGDVIFRDGGPASVAYLVVEGDVSLEFGQVGKDCHRILIVGPGELLAWSAILEQPRLTANARALTPAQLIKINAPQLADLCDQHTAFGYEIMKRAARALASRLTAARMQLMDGYRISTSVADPQAR